MAEIYKAISEAMADIGVVKKDSKNNQQNFMYRGIDAVMNAINPALIKHHIFVVPEVLEQKREERSSSKGGVLIYSIVTMKFRFFTTDGSCVEAVTIGEGMDSGDKATNKAMSIAFKYACFQVFCIPTDEMIEADAETHETAQEPLITPEEKAEILKELNRTHVPKEQVTDRYHVETLDDIPQKYFEKLISQLKKVGDWVEE